VADIHDRMPLILARDDYARWLGEEADPRDLMRPFPAELMRMWPISARVNKPENDDPSIIEPIEVATDAAEANLLSLDLRERRLFGCWDADASERRATSALM